MSATNVLININLSISDDSILNEFILLLENFFPENLRKGLLKRYSFHGNEYDVDRNIYITSITQWKHLLLTQVPYPHFFQIKNHSFYFDCLKSKYSLSLNLLLQQNQYSILENSLNTLMTTLNTTTSVTYQIEKINIVDIPSYTKKQYEKFFLNNLSIHNLDDILSNQNSINPISVTL